MLVPEHDRRILESMAMKKQQERRSEEVAHRAHQLWEQEQRQRRQVGRARPLEGSYGPTVPATPDECDARKRDCRR